MLAVKLRPIAILFVTLAGLGGCSALGKVSALHFEPIKDGWVAKAPKPERPHPAFMQYEFKHHDVSVTTCSLQVGMSVVGIGPPLIPLIPGALFPFRFDPSTEYSMEDLFIYMQINSPTDSTAIDFSKIQLRPNEMAEPAKLKSARRYKPDERWPVVCGRHLREQEDKIVSGEQLATKEDVQYLLIFDFPWRNVTKFSLDIGSITVGGRQVQLPSLVYRKDSYYFYMPLVIPPGGHGQEPWVIYGGF